MYFCIGTDATAAFEDVGHSESAYDMLKDFCIGVVGEKCSQPLENTKVSNTKPIDVCCGKPAAGCLNTRYNEFKCFILIKVSFFACRNWSIFAGVAIFGCAVAYKLLTRS